jgi:hypothetical protein
MTQRADRIVHGSAASARVEPHRQLANLTTVVITMPRTPTQSGTYTAKVTAFDLGGYPRVSRLLELSPSW